MQPNASSRIDILETLGNALHEYYLRTKNITNLDQAIFALQQTVDLTPSTAVEKPHRLNNLGTALRDSYSYTGNLSDIDKTLALFDEIAQLTSSQEARIQ